MNQLNVKLESFEGPLPLLIHLIEKNKINIYDIPISDLTDQYLEYVDSFSLRGMESISEFLVMAATLLEIKSRMLLPIKPSDDEDNLDPREELVSRLIQYKRFKEISEFLAEKEFSGGDFLCKKPQYDVISLFRNQPDFSELLDGITTEELFRVFNETLSRRELRTDKIRSGFNSVKRDMFTIESKIKYITDLLKVKSRISFTEVFESSDDRFERVVTFLALLELIKLREINIRQDSLFGEITVTAKFKDNS